MCSDQLFHVWSSGVRYFQLLTVEQMVKGWSNPKVFPYQFKKFPRYVCPNRPTPSLIYSATIKMEDETKTYVGQTNNTFKKRMDLHNSDTNCGRTRCTLSAYLIEQRRKGKDPEEIRWSLIKPVKPRERGDRYCQLCLSEKAFILRSDPELTLNKRSELLRRCRHRDSLMLSNFYSRTFENVRWTDKQHV